MTSKWDSSRRRLELPAGWSRLRRRVLRECEGRCEIGLAGCVGEATEVDHIRRGDDHSRPNLRGACRRCHALKSSVEGNARSAELRRLKRRPAERHPGAV